MGKITPLGPGEFKETMKCYPISDILYKIIFYKPSQQVFFDG